MQNSAKPWGLLALEEARGGCEQLMKVGFGAIEDVGCALGLRIVITALWWRLTGLGLQQQGETRIEDQEIAMD